MSYQTNPQFILAAKCQMLSQQLGDREGFCWEYYYFKLPLSEASVSLKTFEQTATEGRKAWGKNLGQRYGAEALRRYATQRKRHNIVELTSYIFT